MNNRTLPTISLVTPSYNQGCYLAQTIQSVLHQNYPRLEYFVLDGGSTDQSVAILRHYSDRLTHWRSQPDNGQAHAINQGFADSSGEILGWLNSDDILWPGALDAVGTYFATHPKVDVLIGRSLFFHERGPSYVHDPLPLRIEYLLYSNYFLPQESVYWRRCVYEQIGDLNLDDYVFDHDYFIRMALIGTKSETLHRPIGGFRQHEQQKTANQQKLRASRRQIQERYFAQLGVNPRQAQKSSIHWQLRMKHERALRKLRRLTAERRKVAQEWLDAETYLHHLQSSSNELVALFCDGGRWPITETELQP